MLRIVLQTLYWLVVTAVVTLTLLLIASFFSIANYEVKVVLSGSMQPTIDTGSIVVITPTGDYEAGDVITFGPDTQRQVPTTHRIVEKRGTGENARYVTKGDANDAPDEGTVREREIIGEVLFNVPYIGHIITFAKQPIGFFLLIGVPAAIIAIDELVTIFREVRRLRRKRGENDGSAADEDLH